jgi:hypothetical protein
MIFKKKTGSRVSAPAEVIFKELERAKVDGSISLQTIVDNARPKTAPLHGEFTWANGEAADKWRLYEARKIVQSIEIVHESSPATRAYEATTVIVEQDEGSQEPAVSMRVFRSVSDIMADPVARDELLTQAIQDAIAWRKRYAALQELAQVFAALDAVVVTRKMA